MLTAKVKTRTEQLVFLRAGRTGINRHRFFWMKIRIRAHTTNQSEAISFSLAMTVVTRSWLAESGASKGGFACFLREHAAKSVIVTDGLVGCPHKEGIDYSRRENPASCAPIGPGATASPASASSDTTHISALRFRAFCRLRAPRCPVQSCTTVRPGITWKWRTLIVTMA
jgi:hypothetical protein